MLKNTFCHLNGVGLKREAQLWTSGITTWDALVNKAEGALSTSRIESIAKEIEQSYVQLNAQNACYFVDKLNPSEHWRIISEFYASIAFLDIETTGLNSSIDDITTIALYDGQSIHHYIHGKNLDAFPEDIRKYKILVTYNGKCFDIPFIERYFNTTIPHAHIDLRFVLKSLGYSGGLKNCETHVGIHRGDAAEIDGFFAIFLWHEYERHSNVKALESLLSYNIEDVLNLELLMIHSYNAKIQKTPFSKSHVLDMPEKPKNPFAVDVETVAMIRREFYGR